MPSKQQRYQRRHEKRLAAKREALAPCLDFDAVFSFDHFLEASFICQRGVLWKKRVQGFVSNRSMNCSRLSEAMLSGTYKKRPADHFVIRERGKVRNIAAVGFEDRIVLRVFCKYSLLPVLTRGLITDNGASLEGKGVLGLGNQTSQIGAIYFASPIDHAFKEGMCIAGYGRYMDDGYVMCANKEQLRRAQEVLRCECAKLNIILNPTKVRAIKLVPGCGFTYLKTVFHLHAGGRITTTLPPKTIANARRRFVRMKHLVQRGVLPAESLELSFASWQGVCLRATNGQRIIDAMRVALTRA
ncbi:MAG: hypothetical protein RR213_06560 [Raoultibacter sp.]